MAKLPDSDLMDDLNLSGDTSCENDDSVCDPDYVPDSPTAAGVCHGSVGSPNDVRATSNVLSSDTTRATARCHLRTGALLARKRSRAPDTWKGNVRKRRRQDGQEYVTRKGKVHAARSVKTTKDCTKCKFHCSASVTNEERQNIHREFWNKDDSAKTSFYARTTEQEPVARRRTVGTSRRATSIRYWLPCDGARVRVCRSFYLTTLDISNKRIRNYNLHKEKHGMPASRKWGKSKANRLPEAVKDGVRAHIMEIPRVESHYCRANTKKEYVESGLNLTIIFEKYVEQCKEKGTTPCKIHVYRKIFNEEFNIAFHVPKKDRCDTCEAFKQLQSPSNDEIEANDAHMRGKCLTKEERDKDRHEHKTNMVISFDLQNVFALPKAEISNFFYRRKLNVYNMTAHCSTSKVGYGALWSEALSGRSGNDIASATIKLLERIVKDNANDSRIGSIILWSDSCVPQNRNRAMSTAIAHFLQNHPEVHTVTHKYCEPGHTSIQEVDNLHSQIERVCSHAEIYSPVGLRRMLKQVNRAKPLQMTQMEACDFKDYLGAAQGGDFKKIPYMKVKALKYMRATPRCISYKTSFSLPWTEETVRKVTRSPRRLSEPTTAAHDAILGPVRVVKQGDGLSEAKKADIRAMLKFMPPGDRAYMQLLV